MLSVPSSDTAAVDASLIEGVPAHQRIEDLAVDVGDRVEHALAEVAGLAVAQLDGLELAG